MDKDDYPIESPPEPPRKARRKPLTMREQGIDVACRNGQFILPSEPEGSTPMVTGLRKLSLFVYNRTADLKMLKAEVEAALLNADGEWGCTLKQALTSINKKIRKLIKLGYRYRCYILEVEGGKPLNEPKEWIRN